MLFHVSIEADRPQHVATVIAEFWGGKAMPFPPVAVGSWVALAGDERGTLVEVYPRGTELHESSGAGDAVGLPGTPRRRGATHMALATAMQADEVLAILRREGWPAKICNRGGKFHVIECWIEGAQMVELLTPAMQREYLDFVTIENWQALLARAPALAA